MEFGSVGVTRLKSTMIGFREQLSPGLPAGPSVTAGPACGRHDPYCAQHGGGGVQRHGQQPQSLQQTLKVFIAMPQKTGWG